MKIEKGILSCVLPNEAKGEFVIPDSVMNIGSYAFSGCTSLTGVTFGNGVTSIGNYAFSRCTGLTSVTFGENSQLTSIGDYAFDGCSGLTSVTIPDSVTSIGWYAFKDCRNLQSKFANFKAFRITPSGELKCLNKIYREGRKSFAKGKLALCAKGIHYCTNLFDLFAYYFGEIDKDIAIYECDVSEENIGKEGTSKRCARWIVPRKRLYREDVIRILNGGE